MQGKKLVSVLATSALVIEASKEAQKVILDRVPCIHYLVQFQKDKGSIIWALIDSNSEVNAMTPAYAKQLGLQVRKTDVKAQKIDGSLLRTFKMVMAGFQVVDKLGRARFFQESFLLAETSMEVVLGMLFLAFSNANIQFAEKELIWRSYTAAEALATTKWVELINKKKFAKAALDEESETFVVYIAALEAPLAGMAIYYSRAAQILALIQDKPPTKVPPKYANYADVFSFDLAMELPQNTGINKHAIKLQDGKQPPYGPIYSLKPVELETLKTYIKTHSKTGFIWPFKSLVGALILFDKTPDGSLRLCVNYQGLNNLTIKNWYLLPVIDEALDRLGRAKQFTQLDLTSAYHQMWIREGNE